MLVIKTISAAATFSVRHPVLRKRKPIESCQFDGDDLATTQHFGLYEGDELQGVISIFDQANPLFKESKQRQIRGMAVLESKQRLGYGKLLVQHCEAQLAGGNANLIWFNARENAVDFYKKMGYTTMGTPFEIKGIGWHYVMFKKI